MTRAILARELHILTTVGRMPYDEAIEFLSKAARAAGGVHQVEVFPYTKHTKPGGIPVSPGFSQTRQSR